MARRLVHAGHELIVWNRTPEKAEPLRQAGARVASSPQEAGAASDVAVTMLSTPRVLQEVVFGGAGLASGLTPGAVLIEMSTVGPDAVRHVAACLPQGTSMVDAPVRGSVKQAEEGSLRIFAGGTDKDVRRVMPVLEVLGAVRHVGDVGAGASMKLVVNLCLGALITAVGEALSLGAGLGLDREDLLAALSDSPIGQTVDNKRHNILSGDYSPNFKLSLAHKDLELVIDAAERNDVRLELARAANCWFEEADAKGLGALDYSAVVAEILGDEAR
jgi:3-hydroxyisobutyrate dehydrogenase-like beta-hydroxyacid dehydrogenase